MPACLYITLTDSDDDDHDDDNDIWKWNIQNIPMHKMPYNIPLTKEWVRKETQLSKEKKKKQVCWCAADSIIHFFGIFSRKTNLFRDIDKMWLL